MATPPARRRRAAPRAATLAALVLAVGLAAGCTSDANNNEPPDTTTPTTATSSPTTPTPSPSSTGPFNDPKFKPAIDAYLAYRGAYAAAAVHPGQEKWIARLVRYTFDPALPQTGVELRQYAAAGVAFRGTPPVSRVLVNIGSSNLAARPYPTVILTDCPAVTTKWYPVNAKTGKRVAIVPSKEGAKAPYMSTVTVIYYAKHWGVQKTSTDYKRTCTAPA